MCAFSLAIAELRRNTREQPPQSNPVGPVQLLGVSGARTQQTCKGAVLVVHTRTDYASDVQGKLVETGAFSAVDLFFASAGTPTLALLQTYRAVLVYSGGDGSMYMDPIRLGDALADYWDGGGGVVVAASATTGSIAGRFGALENGYRLMQMTSSVDCAGDSLGAVSEPDSPLLVGVTSLDTAYDMCQSLNGLANGGIAVASWARSGRALIVRGTRNSRPLVELNLFPPSADAYGGYWRGDGTAVIRNALVYVASRAGRLLCLDEGTSICTPCTAGSYSGTAGAYCSV